MQGEEADDQLLLRHRLQPPPRGRDHARRHVQPEGLRMPRPIPDSQPCAHIMVRTTHHQ